MRGVCLSRTPLADQFCFCIYDFDKGKQIRPLISADRFKPKFGLQTAESRFLYDNIWPGTVINYNTKYEHPKPFRKTHPEDTLTWAPMTIIGTMPHSSYMNIIMNLKHPTIHDLFPTIEVANGKPFITPLNPLLHSVGYIDAKIIVVHVSTMNPKIRVSLLDSKNENYSLLLQDVWQQEYFKARGPGSYSYTDVIARLSIAHPFNPSNQWERPRCYLQLSRIEIP